MELLGLQQWVLILSTTVLTSVLLAAIAKISNRGNGKKLPPGSMGLPLIGETFQFLRAYRPHKFNNWMDMKAAKYGPVFKTSLLGCPTVVFTGQAGNKFLFQSNDSCVINKQPITVTRIIGQNNLLELSGEDHRRMRGAIMQFLKPEALQKFVGRMESVILRHFEQCWEGKETILLCPLMRNLAFEVATDLLFGLKESEERDILHKEFSEAEKGGWSIPLDIPGTNFRRGLNARVRICKRLSCLLEVRRRELEQGLASPGQDLMTSLLTMRDENNKALTEEEIIDNMMLVMFAGHDSTYVLLTHVIRALAMHPQVYQNVLKEHMEVRQGKQMNDPLTWQEIQKMKYTWKVAQETMRLTPPVFGGFKKAIKDIEYKGYIIPKGWQLCWGTTTHFNNEVFKEQF
ncbi:hypothetical protein SUGI_0179040 [Cryptomeria japonica]|uniref:taxane 10-beta-hydroxylase n=1 Tax=Cryptomeria japonica TaxID=3369 RepID=UPI002408A7CE|nr:taxane 10-beta-hydroxylase [Cryptomeria japonica]GLJ11876.1 hypothetical protein SUGI_0179040 [Cryptomeria japonica]